MEHGRNTDFVRPAATRVRTLPPAVRGSRRGVFSRRSQRTQRGVAGNLRTARRKRTFVVRISSVLPSSASGPRHPSSRVPERVLAAEGAEDAEKNLRRLRRNHTFVELSTLSELSELSTLIQMSFLIQMIQLANTKFEE